jgi:hypothetical protein
VRTTVTAAGLGTRDRVCALHAAIRLPLPAIHLNQPPAVVAGALSQAMLHLSCARLQLCQVQPPGPQRRSDGRLWHAFRPTDVRHQLHSPAEERLQRGWIDVVWQPGRGASRARCRTQCGCCQQHTPTCSYSATNCSQHAATAASCSGVMGGAGSTCCGCGCTALLSPAALVWRSAEHAEPAAGVDT